MIITRITTQKNNADRYNIYINDGNGERFGFGLDEDVLVKHQIRKGMEITAFEVENLQQDDYKRRALNDALQTISYKMRSAYEVKQKLAAKEYPEEVIEEAVNKVKEYGYINDVEFAKAYVRTKKRTTDHGPVRIQDDLLQKGVSQAIIDEALVQFSIEEQYETINKIVQKRNGKRQKDSFKVWKKKTIDALTRKGFPLSLSNEVLHEIEEVEADHVKEQELEALKLEAEKRLPKLERKYTTNEVELKLKEQLYRKGYPLGAIEQILRRLKE
ncbi:recombination regulator RecX [Salsuginibacillus kocurii]|uniref:recombination regulator RecX n=1 Tax=Salsuginibacillus kocurii TaxID=427078 RepID=UPI00037C5613|nr:recombination regulator RecX [Salsuginibacillus kocurii]